MRSEKVENIIKSYMTKEEFMNILENIDFMSIKDANIELIKAFLTKEDDKVEPLTINFKIDDY